MKKENLDFCKQQASIREKDDIDALRKVLDPLDTRGVKNSYIDVYLKYYLRKYLRPEKEDTVLEIGCGIGRLTEYIAQSVNAVYGIDIVDSLIDACNSNPEKSRNTFYLKMSEREKLKEAPINKMYIVWVLMLLTDRDELIETLTAYRKILPNLKAAAVLEQVKRSTHVEDHHGRFSGAYRTVDEYREIFHASGFKVKAYSVLGERHHGPFYKAVHLLYKVLPRALAKVSPQLFLMDKFIMGDTARKLELINNKRPTDVLFQLETAG
jgi:ubiquinone/menaquinone biosynthesis C-methylase UbiE